MRIWGRIEKKSPSTSFQYTYGNEVEGDYLYVDKTDLIYQLVHTTTYVFLSRPRRFGKSLLTSTPHSYFEGRKDLFQGLAIEGLETEWTQHPVLHFDMSLGKHLDKEALERYLGSLLGPYEKEYGIDMPTVDLNTRLAELIRTANKRTRPWPKST